MTRPARRRRRRTTLAIAPAWALLAAGAVSMVLPLIFLAATSLKANSDYASSPLSLPTEPVLDNFVRAWTEGQFSVFARNSGIVVVISVIAVVAIAALTAFPLVFITFRGRHTLLTSTIALMILPASVMVVPTFEVVLQLQLLSTYLGLILVYISVSLPFGIYVMASYYRNIPAELFDSASIDGASLFQTFRSIVLPLGRPALKTLTVLTALSLWNELLFGLVIMQNPARRTLTAGIALVNSSPQLGGETNTPVLAAALALAAAPPFLLYLLFNSSLARGMTAGAIK